MTVGYRAAAVGRGLPSLQPGGFAPVSVVVEVGEKDDEGDGVADQGPLHPGGERAARVEGVAGVADGHVELDLSDKQNVGSRIESVLMKRCPF